MHEHEQHHVDAGGERIGQCRRDLVQRAAQQRPKREAERSAGAGHARHGALFLLRHGQRRASHERRSRQAHAEALDHHRHGQQQPGVPEGEYHERKDEQRHRQLQHREGRQIQALHHHALGRQRACRRQHHGDAERARRGAGAQSQHVLETKAHGLLHQRIAHEHQHADHHERQDAPVGVFHARAFCEGGLLRWFRQEACDEQAVQEGEHGHEPQRQQQRYCRQAADGGSENRTGIVRGARRAHALRPLGNRRDVRHVGVGRRHRRGHHRGVQHPGDNEGQKQRRADQHTGEPRVQHAVEQHGAGREAEQADEHHALAAPAIAGPAPHRGRQEHRQ